MREGQGIYIGKGGGISPSVSAGLTADEDAIAKMVSTEGLQSASLYDLAVPGLAASENYFQTLQAGQPGAVMRAIAPQAQQINQATTGAKENIMANAPAGGEKNLALEQADLNRAAGVASTATGAVQAANTSSAQLAGQTIGEAQNAESLATSGIGTGIQGYGTLGNLQIESQELQMEQKGQALGAFGGLAGDVTSLGSSSMNKGGMEALALA